MNKKYSYLLELNRELSRIFGVSEPELYYMYGQAKNAAGQYFPHYQEENCARINARTISTFFHEFAHHLQFVEVFGDRQISDDDWQRVAGFSSPLNLHNFNFFLLLEQVLKTAYQQTRLVDCPYPWHDEYRSLQQFYTRRKQEETGK